LEKVDEKQPDAIVLDVMMPRMDGYETVKKLKEQDHTKHIPVVIVTALNDVPNQLKSIDSGADDFLSKPIEEKLLIAKVKLLSTLNIHALNADYFLNLINETAAGNTSPAEAKQKAEEYLQ
jgi:two-component system cell cycle response regulator